MIRKKVVFHTGNIEYDNQKKRCIYLIVRFLIRGCEESNTDRILQDSVICRRASRWHAFFSNSGRSVGGKLSPINCIKDTVKKPDRLSIRRSSQILSSSIKSVVWPKTINDAGHVMCWLFLLCH
jgi:hypothetical protein